MSNTQIQWTKPVCQLDADGLYLGQTEAELDVYTRDGSYIMPAGCIDAPAPEARAGYAAKWSGQSWDYIPDLRGQTAYRTDNGAAVAVTAAGALSDGLTLEPQPTPYHVWSSESKAWQLDDALKAEAEAAALSDAKAAKLAALKTAAEDFVAAQAGLDAVPGFELQTWALQAAEARAWAADNAADTPVLDRIAAARGIAADKLKAAALNKTLAFEALAASAAGRRQALQAKIEAAKTLQALEKIDIAFTAQQAV